MRPGRGQDVRVWKLQQREVKARPWLVRWTIDGREKSRSFRTQTEADRYRSRLLVAQQEGYRFDLATGEPEIWRRERGTSVAEWARIWLTEEWHEWAPRTRRSQVEALARFVPIVVTPGAPPAPQGIRGHLVTALRPDRTVDDGHECARWLDRWSLDLADLNPELLAVVDRQLGIGDRDQALAPATASRFRKVARSCIRRATELGKLDSDPWPPTPKGRARRKARRQRKAVDVRRLPDPTTMAAIIDAMPSHQPGSWTYQAMTAVAYYAGLRPSEVAMLRPRALQIASAGCWGVVEVVEADDGYDEPAEPKTGDRAVPIPPVLVDLLRDFLAQRDIAADQLMFRTRTGGRPTESNWNRILKRVASEVGHGALCPYDCRHACATTWLRAGVPLGEVALRLGHSVETLVSYYVGALQGDDLVANERIEGALGNSRRNARPKLPVPSLSRGGPGNKGQRAVSGSHGGQ